VPAGGAGGPGRRAVLRRRRGRDGARAGRAARARPEGRAPRLALRHHRRAPVGRQAAPRRHLRRRERLRPPAPVGAGAPGRARRARGDDAGGRRRAGPSGTGAAGEVIDCSQMLLTVRILSEHGPVRVELAKWQNRLVVVKSLRGFHPVFSQRLEREAAVLGKLRHDNIVPLLGAQGTSLIYEYCPGVTLEEALRPGPLRPKRSVKIVSDVLRALQYAHENGVIHLDVKPANILVKGERALLTDFGFAKDLGLTAITSQDMMMGTP